MDLDRMRRIPRRLSAVAGRTVNSMRLLLDPSLPVITYYTHNSNWGDALNLVLVERLSGRAPVPVADTYYLHQRPVYSVIGSILGASALPNIEVWGSGFIGSDRKFQVPPRKIHAVRGPLTRELVLQLGVDCPGIYGDPALLFPRFYRPQTQPKYEIGIVPHYMDRDHPWLRRIQDTGSVRVIDILGGVEAVVDEICSCRFIASSSLHGLIAADAYGIPSTWLELSGSVLGDGFKFQDYFLSTGRERVNRLRVGRDTTLSEVYDHAIGRWTPPDLDRLLEVCPFRHA